MKRSIFTAALAIALLAASGASAAPVTSASKLLSKPVEWYRGDEAKKAAAFVLASQAVEGGWPKNVDTAAAPDPSEPRDTHPTFDNSATTDELRFLARMFVATSDPTYRAGFDKGLKYVLDAQYANGGWPQCVPPKPEYATHITFNDGAMARVMFFVKEVGTDAEHYGFVDPLVRKQCLAAFDRGIDCILKCQVKVDGKLTVWCAQHDETTFAPAPARKFEPVSLSGCESVGIVHVLMSVEKPKPEIIAAVDAAVAYLDSVKISGIKIEDRPRADTPRGYERFVVKDSSAPPMWARFYEIGTNKPIFCDRDSVIKYDLADIGIERRTGYQWLKYWPKNLIEKEYPDWKKKVSGGA